MKKTLFIAHHITIINLHIKRLTEALTVIRPLVPLTEEKIKNLSSVNSAFLDVVYSRFGKIQDHIGNAIFPYILKTISEHNDVTFIDKLNRLEKTGYLDDTNWWIELRDIRNAIVHDYEDDYYLLANDTNELIIKADQLITFWHALQHKIEPLLAASEKTTQ